MSVPYDLFTAAFLRKVSEYDFIDMDDFDRNSVVDGYMKHACYKFNHICKYDLMSGDDAIRELSADIPDDEITEIVDIVSEGMIAQWMKPYLYRQENLQNVLNTKDYSMYSPAELLMRTGNAYEKVQKDYTNMIREYSYRHGDLTDLHL